MLCGGSWWIIPDWTWWSLSNWMLILDIQDASRMGWILGIQRSQSARDLKDLPPSKASVGLLFSSITQDWFYSGCKYLDWWEETKHIINILGFVFTVGGHWKWQVLLGMVKLPSCDPGCTWGSVPLAAASVLCGRDHHAFDGAWTYVAI